MNPHQIRRIGQSLTFVGFALLNLANGGCGRSSRAERDPEPPRRLESESFARTRRPPPRDNSTPEQENLPTTEREFMEYARRVCSGDAQRPFDDLRFFRYMTIGVQRGYGAAMGEAAAYHLAAERFNEAANFALAAADKNDPPGMLLLSFMYADGRGVPRSEEKRLYWLVRSAKAGCEEAISQCDFEKIPYK